MTHRRLANYSIKALERLFDMSRERLSTLETLEAELSIHRKMPRSKKLLARVIQAIAVMPKPQHPADPLEEIWIAYEAHLTEEERSYIQQSPVQLMDQKPDGLDSWQEGLWLARHSEHTLIPHLRKSLVENGRAFKTNSDCYGLLMRLAAFEIRNHRVTNWECFALLFLKMFGDEVLPWLPSLFLGAVGLEQESQPNFTLEEIYDFRQKSPE